MEATDTSELIRRSREIGFNVVACVTLQKHPFFSGFMALYILSDTLLLIKINTWYQLKKKSRDLVDLKQSSFCLLLSTLIKGENRIILNTKCSEFFNIFS